MSKQLKIVLTIISLLPILILVYGYINPIEFFGTQEQVRETVLRYGSLAALVFIAIQILQVIVTPLNHYVVGLAGGFIFGPVLGTLYNWIGRVVGTAIAFFIAKRFGRPLAERIIKKETLNTYDTYWNKGTVPLFLAYFLPLFPDDELSYLAGVSDYPAKKFIPTMLLGHIGGSISLALIGSGLPMLHPAFIAISLLTVIAFVIYFYRFQPLKTVNPKLKNS